MRWRPRYTLLASSFLAFFSTMVARLVISPVVPMITDEFGVQTGRVGLALTGMWAAYALMQFPSGVLGHRFGERPVVLLALGLTGAASLLVSAATSFVTFAAFVVLLGTGAGLYFSVAASLLTRTFENVGQALGFHGAGGPIAGVVAPVAATAVAARADWHAALAIGAAVSFPACLLFAVVSSGPAASGTTAPAVTDAPKPDGSPSGEFDLRRTLAVVGRPEVTYSSAVAALCFFTWQSFASFFPTFLVQYGGYTPAVASWLFGATFALSAGGLPLLGRLSDVVGRDPVIAGSLLAGAAGYGSYFVGDGLPAAIVGTVFLSLGLSWTGVVNSRLMDNFSNEERNVGFGFVRTVILLVSSTGSATTGALADAAGWPAAYGFVAGLMGLLTLVVAGNHLFGEL